MDGLNKLYELSKNNSVIDKKLYENYDIKYGLRNKNKTGVLIGISKICCVEGYIEGLDMEHEAKIPKDGELYYRGLNILDIIKDLKSQGQYYFENVIYLLLFGKLPDSTELAEFLDILKSFRDKKIEFPINTSSSMTNMLQIGVLSLYAYDKNPEEFTLENMIDQSLFVMSHFPEILVKCYLGDDFDPIKSDELRKNNASTAKYLLTMVRKDEVLDEEIELLDTMLLLHAEHGAGNNSTFTVRVMSSAYSDTYSCISAGIGSLKGHRHGGANAKVRSMVKNIMENINYENKDELKQYLRDIMHKKAFDKTGFIYGIGHAVYTISDPRSVFLKDKAYELAKKYDTMDEYMLYKNIEELALEVFKEEKGEDFKICSNLDLYSGFIYEMLKIDDSLFTSIFSLARVPSWCAHRIEQIMNDSKIIRPSYKSMKHNDVLLTEPSRI
ncbi:MAG: citrate synthase [Oscillospiraceae bacterium]|nr:citrate synthase [Oscillospiraceae bacterium]